MAAVKVMDTFTIVKLMIFAILVYALLLYWAEWFEEFVTEKLDLEKNSKGRFIFVLIATVCFVVIFWAFKLNPVDILGVNTRRLDLD